MDYRKLLQKYIEAVVFHEGVTFFPDAGDSYTGSTFTQEEVDELNKLADEQKG